jgi:type IV pilus assembly protein PilQ
MRKIIIFISSILFLINLYGEDVRNLKGTDLVSLRADIKFKTAVELFRPFLKKQGLQLVNLTDYDESIGVSIDKLYWKIALKNIVIAAGLVSEIKNKMYLIKDIPTNLKNDENKIASVESNINKDEVLIQLTFFEADSDVLNELGIDWSTLTNGKVNITSKLTTTDKVTENIFSLIFKKSFETTSGTVDVNAIFKAFEAKGKGHVISTPQITVLSGNEGYVHDGENFSIKTTDKDGNTKDAFFSAGTIIKVTPIVKTDSHGNKFIQMSIDAQRSTANPSVVSTVVKISETRTQKILYDGEETVVGGLTVKDEQHIRKGIPILKDLPPWFLGIRYLAGYEKMSVKSKELLIIIKAHILKNIYDREKERQDVNQQIKESRKSFQNLDSKIINK